MQNLSFNFCKVLNSKLVDAFINSDNEDKGFFK